MSKFWFISVLASLLVLTIAQARKYKPSDALEPIKKFREQKVGNTSLVNILLQPDFFDDEISPSNITNTCKAILLRFAEQSSRFTKCLLSNARPFRMCEKCVEHYTRATNLYSDLTNDKGCSTILLLADRMQVMSTIYKTFSDLWTGADCGSCFISIAENSTTAEVTYIFTADTILFQDRHKNMSLCVNDSAEWSRNGAINYKNGSECTSCLDIYKGLNDQFENMRKSAGGHVCMDLVDMMNYTRLMWSTKYGCQRPSADTKFVIILSCLLGFFTVVLYLSSRFNAKIRLPKIFKAKRMVGVTQYGAVSQEGFIDSVAGMPFSSPASPVNSNTRVS